MSPQEMPLLPGQNGPASVPGFGSGSGSARPRLPQNIGHRGYNAAFPENSMAAFHGAIAAGAQALETDLHLSHDGVVVLSHDATLKRCFGVDKKIADCDWSYLRTLQTVKEPRQGMARLTDLLEWLAGRRRESESAPAAPALSVWVLLDIKTDDDPEVLMPAVARAIESVPLPDEGRGVGWRERIVVGCWNENYIHHARRHLPGHQLAFIGFSLLYARKFLSDKHPDVHFNLFQACLVGPLGASFRRAARKRGRKLFVWTVNEEGWMEWAVRKNLDGVITDEVGKLAGVLDRFLAAKAKRGGGGGARAAAEGIRWPRMIRLYVAAIFWQALTLLVSALLWHRLSTMGGRGKPKRG
ncbi:PLC-like phosphodiesterase [Parachaetomium inaequale]|uniref:PLC-like phosphodiesterase n=1 Tax=Parachaetomium inaequale TaxID=2588326 RepID=A0AAN6PMX2_9PEZI|nr:PLC-like phosphodiesterase [Parachaetomium inaequale]